MNNKNIRLTPIAETKAAEDEQRTLIVTISTSTPDRSGDVVVPAGGDLKHFKKNPVVLFGHNYGEPPIARAEQIKINEKDIQAKVVFPEKGIYPFADTIFELYKAKILHAWSIGFIAKESVNLDPDKPWGPQRFEKWEMLEFSAVPVPANPEALTLMRSQGIDESEIKHLTIDSTETKEEETEEMEVTSVSYDPTLKLMKVTLAKGEITRTLTDEELQAFSLSFAPKETPEEQKDEAADVSEMVKALRDALKPADKQIGLVLRTLKTLIEQPTS
jgi:hypothetical protein